MGPGIVVEAKWDAVDGERSLLYSLRRMQVAPADVLFRAMADPTRLRIMNLLRRGELCVGDLVTVLDVPQPTASRHLSYLRRAQLVSVRKRGLWCFYAVAPAATPLQGHLLAAVAICARSMPVLAADAARLRAAKKSGGCCPPPKA